MICVFVCSQVTIEGSQCVVDVDASTPTQLVCETPAYVSPTPRVSYTLLFPYVQGHYVLVSPALACFNGDLFMKQKLSIHSTLTHFVCETPAFVNVNEPIVIQNRGII